MDCPKCKIQNPDNAATCSTCGAKLTNTIQPKRMCTLALWSFILTLCTPVLVFLILAIAPFRYFLELTALAILPPVLAFLFAIFALIRIKKSHGALRGQGFAIASISIIIIGFMLFVLPILQKIRIKKPNKLSQISQLHIIEIALEFFNSENNYYPPSDALDPNAHPYCGAMKLCEAMLGRDLCGFHPDSVFRSDGTDATGKEKLYSQDPNNLKSRKDPYLYLKSTNFYRLNNIFPNVGAFDGNNYVLCDVFLRKRRSGKKIGMPVLYYKADTSKTAHDVNNPDNPDNIYNYKDNHALLALGTPGDPNIKHPLYQNPKLFYEMTRNHKITTQSKPHSPHSFILLSAGKDGLYGTMDDLTNFNMTWKYKQRR